MSFDEADTSDLPTSRQGQQHHNVGALPLLQLADWDEDNAYDEHPLTYIHYSIEWKLVVEKKLIAKETEPNLVLTPSAYWTTVLRPRLDKLAARKLPQNKCFGADETIVTVSVTDRTERDVNKRFDDLDIDWRMLEKQLQTWSPLLLIGKKLRIDISFKYRETSGSGLASTRQGTKRGYSQYMLAERAMQLDAEEDAAGQPSIWRDVYNLMRCPGPPCNLGPYCWRDNVGKRHYKLKTHNLKSLIRYVENGGTLETHDDVPDDIREQLYAEEQQDVERQRKRTASSVTGLAPINITNVLPSQTSTWPAETEPSKPSSPLDIPGQLDVAVKKYSEWQCTRVTNKALKMEYQKVYHITLDEGLDLELIYEEQNAQFYIDKGIKSGIAQRFVRDIKKWAKQYKLEQERVS